MLKLYEAANRVEAQLLKDFMQYRGVETVIIGDYLAGAAGELPVNIYPEVWVLKDDDLTKAEQLVQEFSSIGVENPSKGVWRCPTCGEEVEANFGLCWNCATPREKQV